MYIFSQSTSRNSDHHDSSNMGVKVYNLVILFVDIVTLLVKWIVYTAESIYRLFVPIEEVPVTGEIVLVSNKIAIH